jgi:hypothetical protein
MTKIVEPEKEAVNANGERGHDAEHKSVWAAIDEIMSAVPEEVLSRLPADGAEQHDHYLYGSPKKATRES